jgi:hypothetical protein
LAETRVSSSREPGGIISHAPEVIRTAPPSSALMNLVAAEAVVAIRNTDKNKIKANAFALFLRTVSNIGNPSRVLKIWPQPTIYAYTDSQSSIIV